MTQNTVFTRGLLVAGLALGMAACAPTPPRQGPTDTGNMAFPAPLPQGNIGTTSTTGPLRPTDTGNMAYPAPRATGTLGRTTTP